MCVRKMEGGRWFLGLSTEGKRGFNNSIMILLLKPRFPSVESPKNHLPPSIFRTHIAKSLHFQSNLRFLAGFRPKIRKLAQTIRMFDYG